MILRRHPRGDGRTLGLFCIHQAWSPDAIRVHSCAATLTFDDIAAVTETIVIRADAQPDTYEHANQERRAT